MSKKTKCDGCQSQEQLSVYRVKNLKKWGDTDWGLFTYCPDCAEYDRKHGLVVEKE